MGILCWVPLTEECPDTCIPFTHTCTHTHLNRELSQAGKFDSQSSTLGPVFSLYWTASPISHPSAHVSALFLLLSTLQSLTSCLSHPLPFISSSLPNQRPSVCLRFCVCSSRQLPSLKPVWRNSWRSSCRRSRHTSAASSPMTPNKQVCRQFFFFFCIMCSKLGVHWYWDFPFRYWILWNRLSATNSNHTKEV